MTIRLWTKTGLAVAFRSSDDARLRPRDGLYYDLIRVPHGHIPVTKITWPLSSIPLPLRGVRGDNFYKCPECGQPGFFKEEKWCRDCSEKFSIDSDFNWPALYRQAMRRFRVRKRRRYFKQQLKRIEQLFLPFLAFFRQAWYVHSTRLKNHNGHYMGEDEVNEREEVPELWGEGPQVLHRQHAVLRSNLPPRILEKKV